MKTVGVVLAIIVSGIILTFWVRAKEPEQKRRLEEERIEQVQREQEALCRKAAAWGIELGGCPMVKGGK